VAWERSRMIIYDRRSVRSLLASRHDAAAGLPYLVAGTVILMAALCRGPTSPTLRQAREGLGAGSQALLCSRLEIGGSIPRSAEAAEMSLHWGGSRAAVLIRLVFLATLAVATGPTGWI